jgi:predicted enzyme related to lactoylglutathione lyase
MRKRILITLTLITTFALGFAVKSFMIKLSGNKPPDKKVTGIGGIFFKSKDPKKLRAWYKTHLGLQTNDYGAVFEWRQGADTQWSPFNEKAKYFEPSTKDFMINYRVENLEALVDQLRTDSIVIADKMETAEYGKFIHIVDLEGNKVELWEPNDVEYEKLGKKMGAETTK